MLNEANPHVLDTLPTVMTALLYQPPRVAAIMLPYNQLESFTSTFIPEENLKAQIPKRKIALIDGVYTAAAFFAGEGDIKTSLFRMRGIHPLKCWR